MDDNEQKAFEQAYESEPTCREGWDKAREYWCARTRREIAASINRYNDGDWAHRTAGEVADEIERGDHG